VTRHPSASRTLRLSPPGPLERLLTGTAMNRPLAAPVAAPLSFLVPGLGQAALGRRRRGVLIALPAIVILAGAGVAAVALAADPSAALDLLPGPEVVAALLVLQGVLLAYHVAAILDADRLARAARPRGRAGRLVGGALLAVLVGASVVLHATVGYVEAEAGGALGAVFDPGGGGGDWAIPPPDFAPDVTATPLATTSATPTPAPTVTPLPSLTPAPTATAAPTTAPTPTPTPAPTPAPSPTPRAVPAWARDGRLDLLLVGSDAGPDRWSLRTDTLIVLSVQVKTGRAALFGIPRNLVGVPLPPESAAAFPDGRFPGLLNALYVHAMAHPEAFPGGEARGMRAVSGAVQELVGIPLDGMVVVNLGGFVRLVDELGGLWIDVPEPLFDRNYPLEDGSGYLVLDIRAGCQHLDGRTALAYARSRHQDSDYGRMARQQTVLLSLRRELDPVELVPKVPALLRIVGDSLWTTIERGDVRGLAKLAAKVDARRVARVQFAPPGYPSHLDDAAIERIREAVRTVFDGPPPAADPALAPGHCP
jgi:LCP family protein required for cell wall assembly